MSWLLSSLVGVTFTGVEILRNVEESVGEGGLVGESGGAWDEWREGVW